MRVRVDGAAPPHECWRETRKGYVPSLTIVPPMIPWTGVAASSNDATRYAQGPIALLATARVWCDDTPSSHTREGGTGGSQKAA